MINRITQIKSTNEKGVHVNGKNARLLLLVLRKNKIIRDYRKMDGTKNINVVE